MLPARRNTGVIYTIAQLLALTAGTRHPTARCAFSPLGVWDTLPTNMKNESVSGIAAMFGPNNRVVGWVYRTTENRIFVQISGAMSQADQNDGGLRVDGNATNPRLVSPIMHITRFPWHDLTVLPCSSSTGARHDFS